MYFLNYTEVDFNYYYMSTVRLMLLKQNNGISNLLAIKVPNIKLSFIFTKETELNKIKLYNNVILFWLLTGKIEYLKDLNYKLERGVKYYNFNLSTILKNKIIFFKFIDFFFNNVDFYIRTVEKMVYNYKNNFFYYLKNLELFSNLRLSYSYYTSKMNDYLYIRYFFNKSNLSIISFLNKFKING